MRKTAFIAAIVVCSAQAWAADDAASGIQKSKDQYMAAFNKGDAGAVAQLYTQQAYVLPPGTPMITGRSAIQDHWESGFKAGAKNLILNAGKIDRFGDVAREVATYSFEFKDSKIEGKYVGIWKPENGTWKLDTDVWNMDKQ